MAPYCDLYGGNIMNATIDRYAYATLASCGEGVCRFTTLDGGAHEEWRADGSIPVDGPLRLLKGVYNRIVRDYLGGEAVPLQIKTFSDAPPGSGLGSSSTMVVALLKAFEEYFNLPLGEYEIAHLAYEIERKDLCLAGGKQDQYAASFGGFNFMEFTANDHVVVNPLRIKDWIWAELEASMVLYFTGVSRESATIIDQQVSNVGAGKQASIDAMHSLKREAVQMKESILRGDFRSLEKTFQAGWEAKKKMAAGISNPLIDQAERVAFANGARAAKVSGAGGGGFMMFLCDPEDRLRLSRSLLELGGNIMDFHFIPQGATAWRVN